MPPADNLYVQIIRRRQRKFAFAVRVPDRYYQIVAFKIPLPKHELVRQALAEAIASGQYEPQLAGTIESRAGSRYSPEVSTSWSGSRSEPLRKR